MQCFLWLWGSFVTSEKNLMISLGLWGLHVYNRKLMQQIASAAFERHWLSPGSEVSEGKMLLIALWET